jgi:hypothetical protein
LGGHGGTWRGTRRSRAARAVVFLITFCAVASGMGYESPSQAAVPVGTLDDVFSAIAKAVPSFAGAFVDEAAGNLLILTSDGADEIDRVREVLADFLGDPRLAGLPVVPVTADFAFSDLERWYDRMQADILAQPGVVSTDIDELANRLYVGFDSAVATASQLQDRLRALDIPLDAVIMEPVAPVRRELSDPARPLVGGVQIGTGLSLCSLGFVAVRAGVTGIVTASHCTDRLGGVEGTVFGQPTVSAPIARETVDPLLFTGGLCPPGRRCRYSDATFAQLFPTIPSSRGLVARPPANSSEWNGEQTYRIREEGLPLVGQLVMKIGQSTGRTMGRVERTCVNINVADSDITMLCQAQASYESAPGDSGSTIITSDQGFRGPDVILLGTHWASSGSFSPLRNMQLATELGELQTCFPVFGC